MNEKMLVTAANGHTGFTTAMELLKQGHKVRALVRETASAKANALRSSGAEIVRGNLDDYRDIEAAISKISRVYFCAPFERNALLKTANFIVAAENAGVEHVVYMNQWLASAAHPAVNTREQWLAKQLALLHRKTQYTFINTGLFGFTYFFTLEMVTQLGIYPTLINKQQLATKALNAPPSEEDQGRVIAAILADPTSHRGKTYRITGPKLISHQDVIDSYSKALGRKIKPMTVDKKMLFKSLKAMGFDTYQFTNVNHYLNELEQDVFSAGESVNNLVYETTGKPAENFDVIIQREIQRSGFAHRTPGSIAKAVLFFFKMLATRAPDLPAYERQQHFPEFFNSPLYAYQNAGWQAEHLPSSDGKTPEDQSKNISLIQSPASQHDLISS